MLFKNAINEDRLNSMTESELKVVYEIVRKIPTNKQYYSSFVVNRLIDNYMSQANAPEFYVIDEGTLLEYGLAILTSDDKKTYIIRECYVNEWTSGYSIRRYNKTPRKYQDMIDRL